MNRPYVFCHMLVSVDGKIMGSYMNTPEGKTATDIFYNIAFGKNPYYKHQGWMCGRVTTDDNFTFHKVPAVEKDAPLVPEGDFVAAPNATMYYVSLDTSGKLAWESNELTYIDTTAHIIEVLTQNTSNDYKAFLRKLRISYIIAGENDLDHGMALSKLKELFGIETLMLGGGGVINWSFIQAHMCDELSVVIAPSADGSSETPALFETRGNLAADNPVGFALEKVEVVDGDSVWLRYKVKND